MTKMKINNNFLKKINNLIFATIGILIIVLSIKYNQYSTEKKTLELVKLTKNEYFKETTKFFLDNLKSNFFNILHVIQKGENMCSTVISIFQNLDQLRIIAGLKYLDT